MLLWFNNLAALDFEALMAVYKEGNALNGSLQYPNDSPMRQKCFAERDFEDYLRQIFFCQEDAAYCVFSENGTYISAVRIEPFEDGYLLSALETKPDCRRRGYGKRLIESLILECTEKRKLPIYSHVMNKNIASINLHLQCGFRVYKDSARYLDGSVRTDSNTLIYEK